MSVKIRLPKTDYVGPELRDFQKIAVWKGIHVYKGRFILGDDPGLGKTPQSLHIAKHFFWKWCEQGTARPIVVLCPASVKYQWQDEATTHLGWRSWVLEGLKPPSKMPLTIPPIIILNWDILRGGWVDKLRELKPGVVIADEVHAVKNGRSQRSQSFRRLIQGVPHIIGLTGTVIENSPMEFFNILNIMRKEEFPSQRAFGFRYTVPRITPWGVNFEGSANEKELHERVTRVCFLRRTKKQVLKDLPPLTRVVIPLSIRRKEYEEAESNFLGWLFRQNPGKAIRIKNAIHMAKVQYLLGLAARLKVPSVVRWIQDFHEDTGGKKLVVFGHHREFLEGLHRKFKQNSVLVYGGLSTKKRRAAIDRFVQDSKCNLFFGSIMATGTGINRLQHVCSDTVIAELIYNGKKIEQSEGRLHRMGQVNPVTAYYLVARDTVESRLCKVIHEKEEIINAILSGKQVKNEFDLLKTMFNKRKKK